MGNKGNFTYLCYKMQESNVKIKITYQENVDPQLLISNNIPLSYNESNIAVEFITSTLKEGAELMKFIPIDITKHKE